MSEDIFEPVAAATTDDAVVRSDVGLGPDGGGNVTSVVQFLCPKCQNQHSKLATLETHVMQCCPDRLRDVAIIGQKRVCNSRLLGARSHQQQQRRCVCVACGNLYSAAAAAVTAISHSQLHSRQCPKTFNVSDGQYW